MAGTRYDFYECSNPSCRLRFPGYEGFHRSRHCPKCRSDVHAVAEVDNHEEQESQPQQAPGWKVAALLDNIRSAWNVGSIFRTAEGGGINKLYLCGITPSPVDAKIKKTALGAEVTLPWEMHNNGVDLAQELKRQGYRLWALEATHDSVPLFQAGLEVLDHPVVIVVGNEIAGIDPGIISVCDKVISIPMLGKKKSYNVAVAFGMAVGFLLYRHSVSQESVRILPKT